MHKHYTLVAIILLVTFTNVSAQLTKESLWVGGSLNYGISRSETDQIPQSKVKSSSLFVTPYIGKSTSENAIVGISFHYRTSNDNSSSRTNKEYGSGIFYRKYKVLGNGFYLFGNAHLGYIYGREKNPTENPNNFQLTKTHTVRMSAYPGIAYAINRNIHLEVITGDLVSISYFGHHRHTSMQGDVSDERVRQVQVSTSLNQLFSSWGIGFRFLLNGKTSNQS